MDDLPARVAATNSTLVALDAAPRQLARCVALRRQGRAWILMLAARSDPDEQLAALRAGADAYVPTGSLALIAAEARTLLRRDPAGSVPRGPLPVTPLWALDVSASCLTGPEGIRPLAPLALRVLRELLARPGEVVSRAALLAAVWGRDVDDNADEVDQYICALRRKLEPDPKHPRYLLTVRGRGYCYRPPSGGTP